MEAMLKAKEESQLILPTGRERLMEKVRKMESQVVLRKNDELMKRFGADYGRTLEKLASRWFLISNHRSLPKDELQALDYIVHKRSISHLTVWTATNIGLVSTIVGSLSMGFSGIAFFVCCLVVMGLIVGNVIYFGPDSSAIGRQVFKFLRSRRFLKKHGCFENKDGKECQQE